MKRSPRFTSLVELLEADDEEEEEEFLSVSKVMEIAAPPTESVTKLLVGSPPNVMKRKTRQEEGDNELSFSLDSFNIKEEEPTEVWVHLEQNSEAENVDSKIIQRESLLNIFQKFGEIIDFYIPLSTESLFCYVKFATSKTANVIVDTFREKDPDKILKALEIPTESQEKTYNQLLKITKVELASKRGLLYSNRIKKRRRNRPFDEDKDTEGGFATISQVSQMENNGEDINEFKIPTDADGNIQDFVFL